MCISRACNLTIVLHGSQTICWLNLSQHPEIMPLQRQLYSQLHQDNEQVPDKATDTIENQLRELRKIAAKRLILVVLDGGYSLELLFTSRFLF